MSGFTGRRAPNVSQYLANLNTIPNPQDLSAQQAELGSMGDDGLDFLTNAEFFDFDQFNPAVQNFEHPSAQQAMPRPGTGYPYAEYPHPAAAYPGGSATNMTSPSSLAPSPPAGVPSQQPGLQGIYPPQPQHYVQSPTTGEKRRASPSLPGGPSAVAVGADVDEHSRFAAEEDKRRRNTAASARFRVKKKQREQALEKQAKEMTDKVTQLENKVQQLEMENKWLKELITEKSDGKAVDAATALSRKSEKLSDDRSTQSRDDGVGTVGVAKVD